MIINAISNKNLIDHIHEDLIEVSVLRHHLEFFHHRAGWEERPNDLEVEFQGFLLPLRFVQYLFIIYPEPLIHLIFCIEYPS